MRSHGCRHTVGAREFGLPRLFGPVRGPDELRVGYDVNEKRYRKNNNCFKTNNSLRDYKLTTVLTKRVIFVKYAFLFHKVCIIFARNRQNAVSLRGTLRIFNFFSQLLCTVYCANVHKCYTSVISAFARSSSTTSRSVISLRHRFERAYIERNQ